MHMLSIRKITVLRGMVWSSGQRACLIFRRSEFESRLRRHLFSDIVSEKNEYNKKGSGFAHFEKNDSYGSVQYNVVVFTSYSLPTVRVSLSTRQRPMDC